MIQDFLIILPFVILLLSIAIFPIVKPIFWERNYIKISLILSSIVVFYYLFYAGNGNKIVHSLEEYFSFITLLFSLYLVSGGIFIKIRGKSTPIKNVLLLFTGGVIANFFGTTGASMLLIRPYLETNKYRLKSHQIVFFIFIVGNIGGSLMPVGDPPLLIGYLKGITFFWYLTNLLHIWAFAIVLLLIMFYIIDKYFYEKVKQSVQDEVEQTGERIRIEGKWNLIPLFIIILSVMISEPKFLREIVMLLAAVISFKLTPSKIHNKNNFSFGPIKEVAVLFLGIFLTMIPALVFVSENSLRFGLDKLGNVFWFTGILTSFLDNAPTFLNFLTGAMSVQNLSVDNPVMVMEFAEKHSLYLRAISIAAVFFGAITYVGNAPNFMIKSIAEHEGLKMAGFFEYMYKYSLVILLPVFVLIWFLFF